MRSACAALLLAGAGGALAATDVIWQSPVSGSWTDGSKWSGGVAPMNGTPGAADAYNVTIGAGPGTYQVTLGTSAAVDSLALNGPADALVQTGGSFSVINGVAINSGSYRIAPAAFSDATFSGSITGGRLNVQADVNHAGATVLNNVTFTNASVYLTTQNFPTTVTATNGFSLSNSSVNIGGNLWLNTASPFGGTGTLAISGGLYGYGSSSLTIPSTMIVRGEGGVIGFGGASLVNNSTITVPDFRQFQIGTPFLNNGTVKSSGIFTIVSTLNNNGLMIADGGAIRISSTTTLETSRLGNIRAINNGTIELASQFINHGNKLLLDDTSGAWSVTGSILGGTLATAGAAQWTGSGTLNAVTLDGVFAGNPTLVGSGVNLTSNGSIHVKVGESLKSAGGPINGTGTIDFDESTLTHSGNFLATSPMTIGSGVTVRTGTGNGGVGGSALITNRGTLLANNGRTLSVSSLANQGTMKADAGTMLADIRNDPAGVISIVNGGTFNFVGDTWSNLGTVSLGNGELNLGGSFLPSAIGTINRTGGTINVVGTMSLNGGTFSPTGSPGEWRIAEGATLANGTILSTAADRPLVFKRRGSTGYEPVIDNMTLTGSATISDHTVAHNNLTLNNGTLTVALSGLKMWTTGATLGGTGTVLLKSGWLTPNGAVARMNVGPGIAIRTGGTGTSLLGSSGGQFQNAGLISAEAPGQYLIADAVTNAGAMQVINGSAMELRFRWSNSGSILNDHSTLTLSNNGVLSPSGTFLQKGGVTRLGGNGSSSLTLSGAVLSLSDGAQMQVRSATVNGGTISGSADSALAIDVSSQMVGTTFDVATTVLGVSTLTSTSIASGRQMVLASSFGNASLYVAGTTSGPGEWVLPSGTLLMPVLPMNTATFAGNLTVRSGASDASIGGTGRTLSNLGTISARTPGKSLTLAGRISNGGMIEAIKGGSVFVADPALFTQSGTFNIGTGSEVVVNGDFAPTSIALLRAEMGGNGLGGQLEAQTAHLAGALEITFDPTYSPHLGDRLTLLSAAGVTGTFDTTAWPGLPSYFLGELSYAANGVSFTVVPEPATGALGGGLAVAALRRKRRR
ncbi:MAG TPA: hypothetical protein VF669_17645 [Tepidisphaeraceae bacterium]